MEAERGEASELVSFTCNFLFLCSGYYNYEQGYTPEFTGVENFKGRIVHPQKWTEDIDYDGQARGRDRLGRHGGDAGAGDGEDGDARDDAAALADLCGRAARIG